MLSKRDPSFSVWFLTDRRMRTEGRHSHEGERSLGGRRERAVAANGDVSVRLYLVTELDLLRGAPRDREPEAEVKDYDRRRSPGLEWRNAGPSRKGCRWKRGRDRRRLSPGGGNEGFCAIVDTGVATPRDPPVLALPPSVVRSISPPSSIHIPHQVFPISCNLTIGRRRVPRQSAS